MRIRHFSRVASLVAVAAALLTSACTLDKQDAPPLAGPSGYALSVTMTATPDVLPRDGSSSSVVQLVARNGDGKPLVGQRFLLSTNGGKLTERDIVTDAAGQKTFGFIAPAVTENVSTAEIFATPVGTNADNSADRRVLSIRLLGPGFPTADFSFTPAAPGQFDLVTFDASATTFQGSSCRSACSYAWDFGDGGTGSGLLTTHRFESQGLFKVTLTATTPDGTSSTRTRDVTVGGARPLTAVILFSPTNPLAGETVIFDGRSSTTPDGTKVVDYQWDFGNGQTGSGETATTSFPDGKTYLVRLTIRDSAGRTATTTVPVTPGLAPAPTPPVPLTPVITFSPTSILVGNPVIFDCRSSTTAVGETITNCTWDFGDGHTGSGLSATNTFTVAGTYTVRVTVTDSLNRTATTTAAAAVGGGTAAPLVANFTFSKTDPVPGETVNVNASTSTTAPGATITLYEWDFGNTLTASGPSPLASTVYATAGTYTVNLTITDSLGRKASTSKTIAVAPPPLTVNFTFLPASPTIGQLVTFTATTSPGVSVAAYAWNLGNGSTSNSPSPSTTYGSAQTFTVTLTITDTLNRTATVSKPVIVSP